jgi:hypothetical protein
MMKLSGIALSAFALVTSAWAQGPAVLRDLESKNPRTLAKEEVVKLMTGAKMSRVSQRGNQHLWTNDADGTFVISSDNRGDAPARSQGRSSTARGKWHVSDDGRYCFLAEWKSVPTEEWCRFVIETSEGIYLTKSTSVGTESVYKVEVGK